MTHIFVLLTQFNENNMYFIYIDAKQKEKKNKEKKFTR
jgi:hypothetical protein